MSDYKFSFLLLSIICFPSCLYNDTAITEDLGSKYFYLGAGNESQILLGDEKKNIGVTIIPQEVVEYNFNDHYIIAKSITKTGNVTTQHFWIIDKNIKNSLASLDSISFKNKADELGLNLMPRK